MRPEDVPEEVFDAAELALADACEEKHPSACGCPKDEEIRIILAGALSVADGESRRKQLDEFEWLIDARAEYGQPVKEEIDVLRLALEILRGGDHFTGFLPSWWWSEWERRRGKPERCNCGYGGFHEPENPNCNLNKKE